MQPLRVCLAKARIVTAAASHGYKHSVEEVLASPAMALIQDTKVRWSQLLLIMHQ